MTDVNESVETLYLQNIDYGCAKIGIWQRQTYQLKKLYLEGADPYKSLKKDLHSP